MTRYEIVIPGKRADQRRVTLKVEARSWMEALRTGLGQVGERWDARNGAVDIRPDGTIVVTDHSSGRVYEVQELANTDPSAPRTTIPATVIDEQGVRAAPKSEVQTAVDKPPRGRPAVPRTDSPPTTSRRKRPPQLKLLREVWETVSEIERGDLNAEQVLDAALDVAFEHIPCASAQVLVPGRTPRRLRVAAVLGDLADDLQGSVLGLEDTLATLIERERDKPIKLSTLNMSLTYDRRQGSGIVFDLDTMIWGPIRHRSRLLAVLALFNSHNPNGFKPADVRAVGHLTEALRAALLKHL